MPKNIADDQLAEFRLKLRERRTTCLKEIRHELRGSDNERYVDLVGSVHDVADESRPLIYRSHFRHPMLHESVFLCYNKEIKP